jgi:phosphoribosyl-ATP pyrophosphohydrolase
MSFAIADLEVTLRERRRTRPEGSYSAKLFADRELLQRKVMEEAFETCLELARAPADRRRLASEAADLVFHLLVGLVDSGVSFDDVIRELEQRQR